MTSFTEAALDPEGREHAAPGVVLVGHGCPEEGHEAIAEELIDRALVAMDLAERKLEETVQEVGIIKFRSIILWTITFRYW
jgi:hypothetical protein